MKKASLTALAAALAAAVGGCANARDDVRSAVAGTTAITIYSRARPGAVPPETYREPGRAVVPGYAVVREVREIEVAQGRD